MIRFLANVSRCQRNILIPWKSLEVTGGYSASSVRVKSTTQSETPGPVCLVPESLIPFGQDDYFKIVRCANEQLSKALGSPTRFQSIDEREDRTDIQNPSTSVVNESYGKYISKYRGAFLMKNPYDLTIYCQLFHHVQPKTVIEIGSYTGASAVWFSDTAKSLGYDCFVYSIDFEHCLLDEQIKQIKPDTVKFIQGDATKLEHVLQPSALKSLPHPWLVIEDCHGSTATTISYLNQFMITGDYLVMEDTSPYMLRTGGSDVWTRDKLNFVKEFLRGSDGKQYKIDSFFTDYFGYNCTWHWHGFLRKCDE